MPVCSGHMKMQGFTAIIKDGLGYLPPVAAPLLCPGRRSQFIPLIQVQQPAGDRCILADKEPHPLAAPYAIVTPIVGTAHYKVITRRGAVKQSACPRFALWRFCHHDDNGIDPVDLFGNGIKAFCIARLDGVIVIQQLVGVLDVL